MIDQKVWFQSVCNLQQVVQILSFAKTASIPPCNDRISSGFQRVEIFTGGRIMLEDRELGRGTILWHSPGDRLNYSCDATTLFSCIALVFKVADDRHLMPHISRWDPDSSLSIEDFFLESRRLFMNQESDPELLAFYLGSVLMRQIFLRPKENSDAVYSFRLKTILRLFAYEDPEHLSIREISEKTGMSISHIHRLFKQELGVTPHHYVMHQRMQHARTLLQSNCPIKDIARRCGFSRTAAFYKAFRAACGMTPGEYRRSNGIVKS